jgi:diguanylate cyclase (GGDEF)-like protein
MRRTSHLSRVSDAGNNGLDLLEGDGLASAMLGALPDATAVLDRCGRIVAVNRAWKMFALDNEGRPEATGNGLNYLDLCDRSAASGCAEAAPAAAGIRAVLAGEAVQSELEYPCASPTLNRWFLLRVTPLLGISSGVVVSHINITRRKMAEEELAHETAHDPLKGLVNRTLFGVRLTSALTQRAGRPLISDVGVLYIDLDRFKLVNDTYGHNAGDEVLVTCAQRLQNQVRLQDTSSRLGGDEFAVLAPRISTRGMAALAGRVIRALSEPYLVHGNATAVPGSVGSYLAAPGARHQRPPTCGRCHVFDEGNSS